MALLTCSCTPKVAPQVAITKMGCVPCEQKAPKVYTKTRMETTFEEQTYNCYEEMILKMARVRACPHHVRCP